MKKRLLAILLAAIMLVSLLPVTAAALDGSEITSAATELTGGSYYLSDNVTLTSNLTVSGDATLDLNGYVLTGNGEGSVITVQSGKTLTLTDSNTDSQTHKFTVDDDGLWKLDEDNGTESVTGGVITGGSKNQGGGVYVEGTLIMSGGNIVGNTASGYGGGVYVFNGTFTMSGGTITGNTAEYGGGVCINSNSFTMSGGSIVGNTAEYYGGGVYVNGGTFTMNGGTIRGNEASSKGGGVYNDATFNMSAGEINGNTASGYGGGVYNGGTFTMTAGEISGNTAYEGGGVYNNKTFRMSEGKIVGNTADYGGGVYANVKYYSTYGVPDDEFAMTGGSITGNEASSKGGGVYAEGNGTVKLGGGAITKNVAAFADGSNGGGVYASPNVTTVILGGTVQITDNLLETGWDEATGAYTTVANNLYLPFVNPDGNPKATVKLGTDDAVPAAGMKVGVTIGNVSEEDVSTIFTDSDTSAAYFFSDNDSYYVAHDETTALKLAEVGENTVLNVSKGTVSETLSAAISAADAGDTLKLLDNVETEATITVDKTLTLDLNGKVLMGYKEQGGWNAFSGSVIKVENTGNLTLTDSNPTAAHKFTYDYDNGWRYAGAWGDGDIEEEYKTKKLTGGIITNCYSANELNGGGVFVAGSFTMNAGTITMNYAGYGGGVFVNGGSFTMNGGAITENEASYSMHCNGGGVYIVDSSGSSGSFTMNGGSITGNTAGSYGGGVYMYSGSFTMTGGEITNNFASYYYDYPDKHHGYGGGVYFMDGTVTLGGTARITGNAGQINLDNTVDNLYLPAGKTVTISTATAPAPGMVVGVTTQATPSGDEKVAITAAASGSAAKYFTSDKPGYAAVTQSNYVALVAVNDTVKVIDATMNKTFDTLSEALDAARNDNQCIRLLADITENITISNNIILDLNGHVLKGTGEGRPITVNSNKTLTLIDTDPTAAHSGDYEALPAGGVITGGSADAGGGVYVSGTFNMYGGTITGNTSQTAGGGVNVAENATFTMNGGTISGNTSNDESFTGGGVYVSSDSSQFTMTGGTITGNTADFGGGVYVNKGNFTMTGGTVTDNTAGYGGGVCVGSAGTVTLGGTAQITGNVKDGTANNLYLSTGKTAAIGTGDNAPADGFLVSVANPVPTEDANAVFTSNGGAADKYGFFSDQGHKTVFAPAHLELAYIGSDEPTPPPTPPAPVYYDDPTFRVELPADIKNGELTVSAKYAYEGTKITVTAVPDDGYVTKAVSVTDGTGSEIELTDLGDGKYSFKMPCRNVTVSAEFEAEKCPGDDTCPMSRFTDADTNAWYHDGVHFCVENGYMQGVSSDKFAPSGTLSRAMIVTMLWRLEGEPVVNYAMSFKDVEADQWYTEAIRWAQSTGVVDGYSADSFGPSDDVTREQLAAILYNYVKLKGQGFTGSWMFLLDFVDRADISSWADEAVHWCSMKSIVNGKDGKVFDPQGNATRAEAASMVQRFCEALEK